MIWFYCDCRRCHCKRRWFWLGVAVLIAAVAAVNLL